MEPAGLTEQAARTLTFIQGFIDTHGWSPSFQEIADALAWKSKSNVHRILDILIHRGYLAKRPDANRSLVVLRRVPGSAPATNNAVPPPSNLPRYQMLDQTILRNYVGTTGRDPAPHQDTSLRWLAVAMTALPDDYAVAAELRRMSGALANTAAELEKNARSAA
jgi:hypothetical protein